MHSKTPPAMPEWDVTRLLSWAIIALLGCGLGLAASNLRDEWHVRRSVRALETQTQAIGRGDRFVPPPLRPILPSLPARAQVQEALHLARSATDARTPDVRKAMLDEAATAITRAVSARPRWGEAWTVAAYIYAERDGTASPSAQGAFARSYAGAPYLRYAAEWRVGFGLASWPLLLPDVRRHVIDEAIWLARVSPRSRASLFAAFRRTPAYRPFLIRWREVRSGDADIRKWLAREGKRTAP